MITVFENYGPPFRSMTRADQIAWDDKRVSDMSRDELLALVVRLNSYVVEYNWHRVSNGLLPVGAKEAGRC